VLGICLVSGCSAIPKPGAVEARGDRDEAGATAESPARELVYFVAEEGLNVYSEPSAKSRLVAELPLHARVLRSDLQNGYAHIRTEDDRVSGWVDNARLIWRLPQDEPVRHPDAAEPAAQAAGSAAVPVAEPVAAPAPEPESPAAGEAPVTPSGQEPPATGTEKPEPSVFDRF
jgi:hypothetical protein